MRVQGAASLLLSGLVLAFTSLAACSSVDPLEHTYECDSDSDCLSGWTCHVISSEPARQVCVQGNGVVDDTSVEDLVEDVTNDTGPDDTGVDPDGRDTEIICEAGEELIGGVCLCDGVSLCGATETCCAGNGCVDLQTDLDNCGVCGSACATVCRFGECTEAVDVCGGFYHSCAAVSSGEVYCWGTNYSGQVELGTSSHSPQLPTRVEGVSGVTKVACGMEHSCAGGSDGVFCWGLDVYNRLGSLSSDQATQPVYLEGLAFEELDAGGEHTCVLEDGVVSCWGRGDLGQLDGHQGAAHSASPLPLPGISSAHAIDGGDTGGCVAEDGQVRCWGQNSLPGWDTTGGVLSAMGLTGIVDVAVGSHHACAVDDAGVVSCWGDNATLQCGVEDAGSAAYAPGEASPDLSFLSWPVVELDAGELFTCALSDGGEVACWGSNIGDQLGWASDVAPFFDKPRQKLNFTQRASVLGLGSSHGCLISEGRVYCWGSNESGQLGDGGGSSRPELAEIRWR